MRYPLALLAFSAIPSFACAQTLPPMPTSLESTERLTLPKAARTSAMSSLKGFAAIERGKCKTPVSVQNKLSTVSVPMFILVSGTGNVSKVVPLNTDCPGLDSVAATEQLRLMKGNTPVPADGQPHWYWTTLDLSVEFQG